MGYGKDGDKKGDYEGKKGDYDAKKKDEDHGRRRQLDQHGDKKPPMKKDGEGKKDKKDMEPSTELKAAMKACTENELCKKLMECKKKHKESGGKGDGKGKGDHEEVCVEEMKACAADKECSLLHAKLLHYKLQEAKKDGKDGGKDGYGKGEGKGDHGGKDGYGKDGDKKGDYEGKKGDYDAKKKDEDHGRRRQLDQHGAKPIKKKDGESDKDNGKKDYEKKDFGKKDYDKKDDGKKDGR